MKLINLLIFNLLPAFLFSQVKIIVEEIPNDTPAEAKIYIAGNLNQWNPKVENYALKREMDGSFTLNLPVQTQDIEFKFTLGAWETVETDEQGKDIANRIVKNTEKEIKVKIKAWKKAQNSAVKHSTASPNVQIIDETFEIPQLNRKRRIWLYLPPDYQQNTQKKYPVLYMHDGQNLFDEATSFAGEWGVDKVLNELFAHAKTKGIIVVGIDNGSEHRMNEYSPWKSVRFGGGEGYKYVKFIAQTLKPYIDKHYRTLKDRANTGIMGSSMGGLISFYAGLKYPKIFGKIGVFSPSFWISKEVYNFTQAYQKKYSSKFYFLAGEQESPEMVSQMYEVYNLLKTRGFNENEMRILSFADGKHSEWFWRREFAGAYHFLFEEK